jgi:hypothetical protein
MSAPTNGGLSRIDQAYRVVCAGCGAPATKHARRRFGFAWVLSAAGLHKRLVCRDCASRSEPLVIALAAAHARTALVPYVAHLRRLAQAYELNADPRHVGLAQAADVLEGGRLEPAGELVAARAEDTPSRPEVPPPGRPASATRVAGALSRIEQTILAVLASRESQPTSRIALAILSGYSAESGSYSTALGRLRAAGFVADRPGRLLVITADGKRAAGPVPAFPRGKALLSHWGERLGPYTETLLQIVTAAYPNELSRAELAARAGYSAASGNYSTALGRLRKLGLVRGLRATDDLMREVQAVDPQEPE